MFQFQKLKDMLLKLDGFTHTKPLDLNIVYHQIKLSSGAKQICTILFTRIKYGYQKIPKKIFNILDIFQEKISKFFEGIGTVCTYTDNILVITKILHRPYKVSRKPPTEIHKNRTRGQCRKAIFGCI